MADTSFGTLFVQYEAVYRTVGDLFSTAAGPIDLDAAAEQVREQHPQPHLPPNDLRDAIRQAASAAGIPVKPNGDAP